MRLNEQSNLSQVLFEALSYPGYARPEFLISMQIKTGWSKQVFLKALEQLCRLYALIVSDKSNNNDLPVVDYNHGLSLDTLTYEVNKQKLTGLMLQELEIAIQFSYFINDHNSNYTRVELIGYVEKALAFILSEFHIQIGLKHDHLRKTTLNDKDGKYFLYSYTIVSFVPAFDIEKFKSVVRSILLYSPPSQILQKILKSVNDLCDEIVQIYTDRIQPLEESTGTLENGSEKIIWQGLTVTFDKKEFSYYDSRVSNQIKHLPDIIYNNRDLADFALNISRFIGIEVFNKNEESFKRLKDETTDIFRSLFKQFSHYHQIIKILSTHNYIDSKTLIWKDKNKGFKSTLICILKTLHLKGYFKENTHLTNENYLRIANDIFKVRMGIDNVKATNTNSIDTSFIPYAAELP